MLSVRKAKLSNISVTYNLLPPPPFPFLSQDPSFPPPYSFYEPFDGTGNLDGNLPPIGVTPDTQPWTSSSFSGLWNLSQGITTCIDPNDWGNYQFYNSNISAYSWLNVSKFETRFLFTEGSEIILYLLADSGFRIELRRKAFGETFDVLWIRIFQAGNEIGYVQSDDNGPPITWPEDGIVILRFDYITDGMEIYINDILYYTIPAPGYSSSMNFAGSDGAPYFRFNQAAGVNIKSAKFDYLVFNGDPPLPWSPYVPTFLDNFNGTAGTQLISSRTPDIGPAWNNPDLPPDPLSDYEYYLPGTSFVLNGTGEMTEPNADSGWPLPFPVMTPTASDGAYFRVGFKINSLPAGSYWQFTNDLYAQGYEADKVTPKASEYGNLVLDHWFYFDDGGFFALVWSVNDFFNQTPVLLPIVGHEYILEYRFLTDRVQWLLTDVTDDVTELLADELTSTPAYAPYYTNCRFFPADFYVGQYVDGFNDSTNLADSMVTFTVIECGTYNGSAFVPPPSFDVEVIGALDVTGSIVPGKTMVYKWIPDFTSITSVSLKDPITNFDTVLAVYASDGNTQLDYNDDYNGLSSQIDGLNVVSGTTYYIHVKGYSSSYSGSYRLYAIV